MAKKSETKAKMAKKSETKGLITILTTALKKINTQTCTEHIDMEFYRNNSKISNAMFL